MFSEMVINLKFNIIFSNNVLQEKRDKVSRLSGINDLLKKLKFLFELPNKLKNFYEDSNYEEAVKCYLNGVQFVTEFRRFPSLEAIKGDCQHIVRKITADLYKDFEDEEVGFISIKIVQ